MLRRMRVALGLALMTLGALGTVAGPARVNQGAGTRSNRSLAPRSASRLASARVASSPPSRVVGACEHELSIQDAPEAQTTAARPRIPSSEGWLRSAVESRMQQLVAEQLGVDVEEIVPEVSLMDDLAADSLDLLELGLVLESEFSIALSRRTFDHIRTYRDLVDAVMVSFNGRRGHERLTSRPLFVKARVVPASGEAASLERAGELTPYTMEVIAEEAARAGRGAQLEVTVPGSANDVDLAVIQEEFARLGRRGVDVRVRREPARTASWI